MKNLIELYLGRKVRIDNPFTPEVLIRNDGTGEYIAEWNITDKPQPTIEQLEALQPQLDIQENNEKILSQIIELDSKRSRAFFEPSEKEPNLTWLDYYNQEILKLRTQLSSIQST